MLEEKPWYQSRTIWASLIAIAAAIAGTFGIDVGTDLQGTISDAVMQLVTVAASIIAIFGRLNATKVIS